MRLWSVPPLMLALLWIFARAVPLHAADDAGDRFLQVYENYQAGAKLETDGKYADALQKFRFCVSLLEQIQRTSPDYYPILIDARLKKSRAAIARVQSFLQSPPSTPSAGAGDGNIPPSAPPPRPAAPFIQFPLNYRAPSPGQSAPPLISPEPPAGSFVGSDEIDDLKRQLLESMAREQSSQKEIDLWKVRSAEQQSQLAEMKQSLEDLQEANGRLSREKESDQKQITTLQADLDAAHADLEVANEYNGELFDKLDRAAKFIDQDEKIRKQLLAERKELSTRVENRASDTAKLVKERDEAVARRDELQKRVAGADSQADQNKNLAAKLTDAESKIADLSKDKADRDKMVNDLRGEVASSGKTLALVRDDLKSGQKRIAELEKQLSDTANASASVTGEMKDENALLKSLVARQLKEQAKRQQARKLVEEEMEKLQVRSQTLVDRLNTMAAADAPLTPQEKKLVDPVVIPSAGSSDFNLEVTKKMPESDLPPELVAKASQANELSQKRQFAEAREIYAEIAQKAPNSYLASVNLGIAERQLGDYPKSITAFQRALELKPDDAFALTNLGTVQYRNNDLPDAAKTLQKAVEVDSESYLAHYLLGMALHDQGDRAGAQKEVQRSLELKADYAPAKELDASLRGESTPAPAPAATPASTATPATPQ